jgi:hypothetical protein
VAEELPPGATLRAAAVRGDVVSVIFETETGRTSRRVTAVPGG